jgi:hypothetical protein
VRRLQEDRVLELGRIADEGVGARHALHRRIEPREAVAGDAAWRR